MSSEPRTLDEALAKGRYYGRNLFEKSGLDVEEGEQEGMLIAFVWWRNYRARVNLWTFEQRRLGDLARRLSTKRARPTERTTELTSAVEPYAQRPWEGLERPGADLRDPGDVMIEDEEASVYRKIAATPIVPKRRS